MDNFIPMLSASPPPMDDGDTPSIEEDDWGNEDFGGFQTAPGDNGELTDIGALHDDTIFKPIGLGVGHLEGTKCMKGALPEGDMVTPPKESASVPSAQDSEDEWADFAAFPPAVPSVGDSDSLHSQSSAKSPPIPPPQMNGQASIPEALDTAADSLSCNTCDSGRAEHDICAPADLKPLGKHCSSKPDAQDNTSQDSATDSGLCSDISPVPKFEEYPDFGDAKCMNDSDPDVGVYHLDSDTRESSQEPIAASHSSNCIEAESPSSGDLEPLDLPQPIFTGDEEDLGEDYEDDSFGQFSPFHSAMSEHKGEGESDGEKTLSKESDEASDNDDKTQDESHTKQSHTADHSQECSHSNYNTHSQTDFTGDSHIHIKDCTNTSSSSDVANFHSSPDTVLDGLPDQLSTKNSESQMKSGIDVDCDKDAGLRDDTHIPHKQLDQSINTKCPNPLLLSSSDNLTSQTSFPIQGSSNSKISDNEQSIGTEPFADFNGTENADSDEEDEWGFHTAGDSNDDAEWTFQDAVQHQTEEDDFGGFSSMTSSKGFAAFGDAEEKNTKQGQGDDWATFASATVAPETVEIGEEEFQEFEDVKPTVGAAEELGPSPKVGMKIECVVISCFPSVRDANENVVEKYQLLLEHVGQEIPRIYTSPEKHPSHRHIQQPKVERMDLCVWNNLKDLEKTAALQYQWRNSHNSSKLLQSLAIDTRNILMGHKKPGVPIFASSLGLLEPSRGPLEPSREAKPAKPTTMPIVDTSKPTVPTMPTPQDIPPAEFDWSSSGLTNPLDSLESELLQSIKPPEVPKTLAPLESVLANMKFTPTTTPSGDKDEKLSGDATSLLSRLTKLSFMQAKVLMFPFRGNTE